MPNSAKKIAEERMALIREHVLREFTSIGISREDAEQVVVSGISHDHFRIRARSMGVSNEVADKLEASRIYRKMDAVGASRGAFKKGQTTILHAGTGELSNKSYEGLARDLNERFLSPENQIAISAEQAKPGPAK
jgi:hypothetical protein